MKLSTFDLGRVKALHHLLEQAHVGQAAQALGITPAAASNALRRLREDFGDPLLARKGRSLVRTRVGEELREPARAVIAAAERLVAASRRFEPASFSGQVAIALAEHVATVLLPELDRLMRRRAPLASLAIAATPDAAGAWLERSGGVMVSPIGSFAAAAAEDGLVAEPFYEDRYLVALRHDHPMATARLTAAAYAALDHVLVVPRGRTARSDVDDQLASLGLSRRIIRVVPSFTLALPLVAASDAVTAMPGLYARSLTQAGLVLRPMPLRLRPLAMHMMVHPAHQGDPAVAFAKQLLREALAAVCAGSRSDVGG